MWLGHVKSRASLDPHATSGRIIPGMSEYTVGQVAQRSSVSVRALHHYDEIGLLAPSGRSEAGYRLYSHQDLVRLRQILFYRELDFGLEQIGAMLADPEVGVAEHLRAQHKLLRERLARTEQLLHAIENEMEARSMGISLTPEEQLEVFGPETPAKYESEVQERWGRTEAWRESQRRAVAYSKRDWVEIKAQADANLAAFAQAMTAGEPAGSATARALAQEHREHISRWFYECSPAMHARLAELYIADPRFAAHYDKVVPGLAQYVHDAVLAAGNGQ
jgi:MerR family transcriptional regulator, thiopeptide resistance regulator